MEGIDEESSSAGAYYSQDFEWEALRDEIKRMLEASDQHDHLNVDLRESLLASKEECSPPSVLGTVEEGLNICGNREEGLNICGNREESPSTSTSWETFHSRHSRNLFFKERRYLTKEFPDLCQPGKSLLVLEVGCGTGSSVIPIIRANKQATVFACDCSPAALRKAAEVVTGAGESSASSFYPFLCDISTSKLPDFLRCSACRQKYHQSKEIGAEANGTSESQNHFSSKGIENGAGTNASHSGGGGGSGLRSLHSHPSVDCCIEGLDIVTMIFTLSAIPVEKMAHVLSECFEVLKPGGLLLFRDYGLYDMTMLRFAPRQHISSCLYQREDGTLSYFFSLEVVRSLFTQAGFVEQELEYCCVLLTNRRKQVPMKRVWVHAKFHKPIQV